MKAMIIVDVPVNEPCEIDEYSLVANVEIRPSILTHNPILLTLFNKEVRPMPLKRKSIVEWVKDINKDYSLISTHELTDYDKGWNDCVDFLEGDEYD